MPPLVMSWKAEAYVVEFAARAYRVGLTTPCPVEFSFPLMIANIPAKIGAAKLVPPATVKFVLLLSRKPFAQLPVTLVVEENV